MSNTFPNIKPSFINLALPEYQKITKEFDTKEFYQTIIQSIDIGLKLNIKYERMNRNIATTNILSFYNTNRNSPFLLPPGWFDKRFNNDIKPYLTKYPLWKFEGDIKESPYIVNKDYFISDVEFTITNVLA